LGVSGTPGGIAYADRYAVQTSQAKRQALQAVRWAGHGALPSYTPNRFQSVADEVPLPSVESITYKAPGDRGRSYEKTV